MSSNLPDNLHEIEQHQPNTLVDVIDQALVHADQQRAALVKAGDRDNLAWGLKQLRDVQSTLSMLERQVDGDLAQMIEDDRRHEVDGLGVLEVHRRSVRQKWDSERLFGYLIQRIEDAATIDPETGEVVGDMATAETVTNLVRDILGPCIPLTASMGWRTTGLKQAGVDPNRYREREPGPLTVRIQTSEGTK